jgi:DNA-binding NarL/FixJ family response regulator
MPPIRVMCVDDSPDVRVVLRSLINHTPDLECVGTLASSDHLADEIRSHGADVVVLDLVIPGCDPLGEVREARKAGSDARIIMFTGNDDCVTIEESLGAGAEACVVKAGDPRRLLDTIRRIAASEHASAAS